MVKRLALMMTSIFCALLALPALAAPAAKPTPVSHPQCEYPHYTMHIPGTFPKMKIALTLDDGPDPDKTPHVLDLLKKYHISATFFLIGQNIPGNEDIVRRELAEGHNIGNHTYTHPHMPTLSPEQIRVEFAKTDALLAQFPKNRARVARLPYGESSCTVENIAEGMHYNMVGWNMDSCDWSYGEGLPTTDDCMSTTQNAQYKNDYLGWIDHELSRTHGGMFLMHDAEQWTFDHLEMVIQHLQAEGYEFVTVDGGDFPGVVKDHTILTAPIDPSLLESAEHPPQTDGGRDAGG